MTADEPGWVPPGVDTKRANVARVYDYWLGGRHNFLADQDVARAIAAVEPNVRVLVRANRAFLGRAVRFLAQSGIRQFLDIGSGIPTEGNVHEVAQQAAPGSRVVYADIDPVATAHSRALLAGNADASVINGDLREPEKILANEDTRRLTDFARARQLPGDRPCHRRGQPDHGAGRQQGIQPQRVHPDEPALARGDHAVLRRFRSRGAGACLHPAMAPGLAGRRARKP